MFIVKNMAAWSFDMLNMMLFVCMTLVIVMYMLLFHIYLTCFLFHNWILLCCTAERNTGYYKTVLVVDSFIYALGHWILGVLFQHLYVFCFFYTGFWSLCNILYTKFWCVRTQGVLTEAHKTVFLLRGSRTLGSVPWTAHQDLVSILGLKLVKGWNDQVTLAQTAWSDSYLGKIWVQNAAFCFLPWT